MLTVTEQVLWISFLIQVRSFIYSKYFEAIKYVDTQIRKHVFPKNELGFY